MAKKRNAGKETVPLTFPVAETMDEYLANVGPVPIGVCPSCDGVQSVDVRGALVCSEPCMAETRRRNEEFMRVPGNAAKLRGMGFDI